MPANDEINDRIQKANAARGAIKGKSLGVYGINPAIRIMLFYALVTSILLYGLHIIPIRKGSMDTIQQFYSKCARIIIQGYYNSENAQIRNGIIRQKYNITTIGSKLKYFRLKTYYRWKRNDGANYLNDKEYTWKL